MNEPLLRIVVTDANVLINLMHVTRVSLLGRIPNHEFMVPEQVREEIKRPEQRQTIEEAVRDRFVTGVTLDDLGTMGVYAGLTSRLGRGESACIAIAEKEGWFVASDEKKRFLREAEARIGAGRVITTPDLYVLAIKCGLLTVAEADADKITLQRRRFSMPFASFGELVK